MSQHSPVSLDGESTARRELLTQPPRPQAPALTGTPSSFRVQCFKGLRWTPGLHLQTLHLGPAAGVWP